MKSPEEQLKHYGRVLHGVGLLVLVAGAFMAFAFVVTPMQFKINSTERTANQLGVFLDRTDQIIEREATVRTQLESSRDELRQLQNRVPGTPTADEFLQQLDELAEKTGLTILDYQPGQTLDNVTHSETQIELSGKGNYVSLCQFLDGLVQLPRLCRIRTMLIQSASEGDSYPVDLSLSIYFSDRESFAGIRLTGPSRVAVKPNRTY